MKFEVYCDESCLDTIFNKDSHDYMGIGSVWMPSEDRSAFKEGVKVIQNKYEIFTEIKWKKVSSKYIDFYKSLIDYFLQSDFIRYRIIIVESEKIDLVKFHQNDGELGFYKFFYQLLQHWILDYNDYDIYLDDKINRLKNRLKVLKNVLSYSNLSSKINQVQALPSNESLGIQLADFFTGLLTSKFNNKITGEAKKQLILYLESKIGHEIRPTNKSEEKFNVFKINLSGGW